MNTAGIGDYEAFVSSITNGIKTGTLSGTEALSELSGKLKNLSGTGFNELLAEEAEKLSGQEKENTELVQMQELIEALDKSILSAKAVNGLDPAAVAGELTEDGNAGEVVEALMNGHLNGIALSDAADLEKDEEQTIDETAVSAKDTTAETLAQNLETIIAGLGQMSV